MRLIPIILAVGALLAGALYWYFEIHRSAVYARAVLSLWEETESLGAKPELSDAGLKDDRDYDGALVVLRRRRAATEDISARLSLLKPSGVFAQTHNDLRFFLDGTLAAVSDAEQKAKLLANTKDLRSILGKQPVADSSRGGTLLPGSGANTISDIARLLGEQIPQTKSIGGEIFKEGLSLLFPGIPFDKLFSSWQEAAPVLDTILQLVRGFDPNLPASQLSRLLQSSNKQTELDRVNRFLEEAEAAARTTTARDLLSYRSFEGADGLMNEGLELRARRLREAMDALREKYSLRP